MELSDDQSTHTANDEYGRLNPNSLLGGLFFVVSLVFLFYVIPNYINLPPYMQHPLLSPRFLPQLAGWLVLILAFVLMVNGLLYPPKREEADELRQGVPVLRQVLMLAAGAIYAVFFERIGSAVSCCCLASLYSRPECAPARRNALGSSPSILRAVRRVI